MSKAAAVLGTMINIKPLLHVDNEGHLIPLDKVRGRKRSLNALIEMMNERMGSYRDKNTEIFISHGDCQEDAEYVARLIREHLWDRENSDQSDRGNHWNPFRTGNRSPLFPGRQKISKE